MPYTITLPNSPIPRTVHGLAATLTPSGRIVLSFAAMAHITRPIAILPVFTLTGHVLRIVDTDGDVLIHCTTTAEYNSLQQRLDLLMSATKTLRRIAQQTDSSLGGLVLPVNSATIRTGVNTINLHGKCTVTHNADRSAIISIGERLIQLSAARKVRECKQLLGSDFVEVCDGSFMVQLSPDRRHEGAALLLVSALALKPDDESAFHECEAESKTALPESKTASLRVSDV